MLHRDARARKPQGMDDHIINGVSIFVSALVLVVTLYPLIYVVSASFSEPNEVIMGNLWL